MWEADWDALRIYYGNVCAYCGHEEERLTRDHIVPFSKGGRGTITNICLSCEWCNSRKGSDSLVVWLWKRRGGARTDAVAD